MAIRNLSNPIFHGTLEEAVAAAEALPSNQGLWLAGFEVYGMDSWVASKRRVLKPAWDSLGFAPKVGDVVTLGGAIAHWRVVRVAERVGQTFEIRS